jgi:chitinase
MPTTAGYDPMQVAINLALFVTNYNLDGVDIDYQDSIAFSNGIGEQWLLNFMTKLRSLLPNFLIVHTVNAGYFVGKPIFKNGAYLTVNNQVGSLIDFYNVKYFSQSNSTYNTSQSLFNVSTGWALNTSVNQLIAKGISAKKIVVGKTAAPFNADSASYMNATQLKAAIALEYRYNGWNTGLMLY